MAAFVPVPFCSHSLMDRISDSGSDGLGSNPDGSTKNAFVGVYRPYRARKEARFCRRPCLFSYFVLFHEFGGDPGTIDIKMDMNDSIYDNPVFRVSRTCSRGGPVLRRRRCGTSRGRMQRRPDMRQYSAVQCFRDE